MNKKPVSTEIAAAIHESQAEIEKGPFVLIERWDDNDAILLNRKAGRYELWTVAPDGPLTLDLPNDGRQYQFVREIVEFELDEDDVSWSASIQ